MCKVRNNYDQRKDDLQIWLNRILFRHPVQYLLPAVASKHDSSCAQSNQGLCSSCIDLLFVRFWKTVKTEAVQALMSTRRSILLRSYSRKTGDQLSFCRSGSMCCSMLSTIPGGFATHLLSCNNRFCLAWPLPPHNFDTEFKGLGTSANVHAYSASTYPSSVLLLKHETKIIYLCLCTLLAPTKCIS